MLFELINRNVDDNSRRSPFRCFGTYFVYGLCHGAWPYCSSGSELSRFVACFSRSRQAGFFDEDPTVDFTWSEY